MQSSTWPHEVVSAGQRVEGKRVVQRDRMKHDKSGATRSIIRTRFITTITAKLLRWKTFLPAARQRAVSDRIWYVQIKDYLFAHCYSAAGWGQLKHKETKWTGIRRRDAKPVYSQCGCGDTNSNENNPRKINKQTTIHSFKVFCSGFHCRGDKDVMTSIFTNQSSVVQYVGKYWLWHFEYAATARSLLA